MSARATAATRAQHGTGRRIVVAALSIMLMVPLSLLASCAPNNAAVGDTERAGTAIDHDSVDQGDIMIGVVGSSDSSADRTLMATLANERLNAFYAAADGTGAGPEQCARSAANDMDGMIDRAVKIIVINRLTITATTRGIWRRALLRARDAGIPVALVDARQRPDDARLYAVALTTDAAAPHAVRLGTILQQVINDRPHARSVSVSLDR